MLLAQVFSRRHITSEIPAVITQRTKGAAIEMLESRTMLAAPVTDVLGDLGKGVPAIVNSLAKPAKGTDAALGQVLSATIPGVTSLTRGVDGVLTGTTKAILNLAGGGTREANALITIEPNAAADGCPILHLELQEIHLDLLGLNVDTSDICLDIHGEQGPGNLLGNLLCGLTGILDGPITGILGRLNELFPINLGLNLTNFTNSAGELAGNGLLSLSVAGNEATAPVTLENMFKHTDQGVCNILNLSLGPVDLNLLGLVVGLDDCADGPVTVDVTAEEGPGNLLGNLLCGITGILDGGLAGNQLNQLIGRLNKLLDGLL